MTSTRTKVINLLLACVIFLSLRQFLQVIQTYLIVVNNVRGQKILMAVTEDKKTETFGTKSRTDPKPVHLKTEPRISQYNMWLKGVHKIGKTENKPTALVY